MKASANAPAKDRIPPAPALDGPVVPPRLDPYPIGSMYGIFTYMTGSYMGQMLVNIPYNELMGI